MFREQTWRTLTIASSVLSLALAGWLAWELMQQGQRNAGWPILVVCVIVFTLVGAHCLNCGLRERPLVFDHHGFHAADGTQVAWRDVAAFRERAMGGLALIGYDGRRLTTIDYFRDDLTGILPPLQRALAARPRISSTRLGRQTAARHFAGYAIFCLGFFALAVWSGVAEHVWFLLFLSPVIVWGLYDGMRNEIVALEIVDERLAIRSLLTTRWFERRHVHKIALEMVISRGRTVSVRLWPSSGDTFRVTPSGVSTFDTFEFLRAWHPGAVRH